MDEMVREEKYLKFFKNEHSNLSHLEGMNQKGMQFRLNKILDDLQDKSEVETFLQLFWILSISCFVVFITNIFRFGFGFGFFALVALIIYLVMHRFSMGSVIQKSKEMGSVSMDDPELPETKRLSKKINFIVSGIDIKRTRLNFVRWLFVLFFPLLVLALIYVFSSPEAAKLSFWNIFLAYLVCGIFWFFYFREELADLDHAESELLNYLYTMNK